MKIVSAFMLAATMAGSVVFSVPAGTADTVVQKASSVKPSRQVLFFMNPNGRPCRMQDSIINEIGDSLNGVATVKYYKTTNNADYDAFGKYGIRGLPSLIIIDDQGKVLKRFTPGIQDKETILAALHKKEQQKK